MVRAGYGVSTIPFGDNTYAYNFPVKQNNQFNAANAFVPPAGVSMAAGFPAPVVAQHSVERPDRRRRRCRGCATAATSSLPDRPEGRPAALVERRLSSASCGGDFTAEVAYVGNHGQDIIQRLDLNAGYVAGRRQRRPAAVRASSAGRPASTAFLPYHTDYHSMQVKVDRRFRNGFLITNSYTLGKGESYDDGDSNGGDQHADRHRAELGPHGERSQAHVRQQLRLQPPVQGRTAG